MMIDLVSPVFLTYHTSGATLGHIPFHLEVHGSSRTCATITYWMLIETWTWSFILRSLWDPPSQVRTSRHLDSIMPLHLGCTFWICVHDSVMDSDDQYYMFDDRWLHIMLFFGPIAHRCHTGAYFSFQMRFMDLHLCRMIDDRWFDIARFPTCRASDAHTGAYFPFQMWFTDLHLCRMFDNRWFHAT